MADGILPSRYRYVAACLLWLVVAGCADPARAIGFADLPGWGADDHAAALRTYRLICARSSPSCRRALALGDVDRDGARRFFEQWFDPAEISDRGFLTGYFEPELSGSTAADARYRVPLLGRPSGLVLRGAGSPPPGWPDGMAAALRTPRGYEALPDRAAIEDGALKDVASPVAYLADPVDAFTIHVQGSARIRLEDGGVMRVGFDGRNGYPYTAIGKVLAEAEGIPPADLTADRLWSWLKANPDRAPAIMRANRSFIFFRRVEARAEDGPIGGAGVPLTPGRSLAVDRKAWPYGTLVWLDGELPRPGGGADPLHRLVVAQDTGAAIVGTARGDLFFGSGEAAGAGASLVRNPVRWVVLRPRSKPRPPPRP